MWTSTCVGVRVEQRDDAAQADDLGAGAEDRHHLHRRTSPSASIDVAQHQVAVDEQLRVCSSDITSRAELYSPCTALRRVVAARAFRQHRPDGVVVAALDRAVRLLLARP